MLSAVQCVVPQRYNFHGAICTKFGCVASVNDRFKCHTEFAVKTFRSLCFGTVFYAYSTIIILTYSLIPVLMLGHWSVRLFIRK